MKYKITYVLSDNVAYYKIYEDSERSYDSALDGLEGILNGESGDILELAGFLRSGNTFPIDTVYIPRYNILTIEIKKV